MDVAFHVPSAEAAADAGGFHVAEVAALVAPNSEEAVIAMISIPLFKMSVDAEGRFPNKRAWRTLHCRSKISRFRYKMTRTRPIVS